QPRTPLPRPPRRADGGRIHHLARRSIDVMETGFAFAKLDPAAEERFVSLRRALGVSTFGINQVLLAPGQRGRIHRHTSQEEVYLVISGTLTLWIEGERHELGDGAVARVA